MHSIDGIQVSHSLEHIKYTKTKSQNNKKRYTVAHPIVSLHIHFTFNIRHEVNTSMLHMKSSANVDL